MNFVDVTSCLECVCYYVFLYTKSNHVDLAGFLQTLTTVIVHLGPLDTLALSCAPLLIVLERTYNNTRPCPHFKLVICVGHVPPHKGGGSSRGQGTRRGLQNVHGPGLRIHHGSFVLSLDDISISYPGMDFGQYCGSICRVKISTCLLHIELASH